MNAAKTAARASWTIGWLVSYRPLAQLCQYMQKPSAAARRPRAARTVDIRHRPNASAPLFERGNRHNCPEIQGEKTIGVGEPRLPAHDRGGPSHALVRRERGVSNHRRPARRNCEPGRDSPPRPLLRGLVESRRDADRATATYTETPARARTAGAVETSPPGWTAETSRP